MERDKSQIVALEVTINFNSHAHVERDSGVKYCPAKFLYFNSHAHVERDDFLWNADETKFHFNSHAHVERDQDIDRQSKPYN